MSYTKRQQHASIDVKADVEGSRTASKTVGLTSVEQTRFESRIIGAVLQELDEIERTKGATDTDAHVVGHIEFQKKTRITSRRP